MKFPTGRVDKANGSGLDNHPVAPHPYHPFQMKSSGTNALGSLLSLVLVAVVVVVVPAARREGF